MSFLLNAVDLSLAIISWQQVVRPSYETTTLADRRIAKVHDYGPLYDRYTSEIVLVLTEPQWASVKGLLGQTTTVTTTLDLFCPGVVPTGGTSVGVMTLEDYGWMVEDLCKLRRVFLRLKLLSTSVPTGTVAGIQKLIDRGMVAKSHDVGIYAPEIVGTGYRQVSTTAFEQFTVFNVNMTAYEVKQCLDYLLQLRTGKATVTLASRHTASPGSKQVYLTDFRFARDNNNRYTFSLVVTVA